MKVQLGKTYYDGAKAILTGKFIASLEQEKDLKSMTLPFTLGN